MVLNETFESVADGDDVTLLDELGIFSLEECLGAGSLIGDDAVDHGDLLPVSGLDDFGLSADDLDVDIEATPVGLEVLDFDEFGLNQSFLLFLFTHTC